MTYTTTIVSGADCVEPRGRGEGGVALNLLLLIALAVTYRGIRRRKQRAMNAGVLGEKSPRGELDGAEVMKLDDQPVVGELPTGPPSRKTPPYSNSLTISQIRSGMGPLVSSL